MADGVEQRTFPRIPAGTPVAMTPLPLDRRGRSDLESTAHNLSLGGMFLATEYSFRAGTVLQLEFRLPDEGNGGAPVHARAVVRWRRWWRSPRGMGVQFVELEGRGRDRLKEWLDHARAPGPR